MLQKKAASKEMHKIKTKTFKKKAIYLATELPLEMASWWWDAPDTKVYFKYVI